MLPNPREVVDHGDRSSNEGGHASLETRGLDCFLHIDKKTLRDGVHNTIITISSLADLLP